MGVDAAAANADKVNVVVVLGLGTEVILDAGLDSLAGLGVHEVNIVGSGAADGFNLRPDVGLFDALLQDSDDCKVVVVSPYRHGLA